MMKTNPYGLLGLNLTGTSNANEPYSMAEISSAYKARSLKLHPDKNPGNPDAQKNFTELKEAYELLTNETARAAFDRTLLENPSLADHGTHLFVELETPPSLPAEPHSRALALKTVSGVNLTQLILNARASNALILSLAVQKPEFAKTLLTHTATRDRLSLQEQFKLIFIVLKHQHDRPDFLLAPDEKNIIQYLLNQVTVKSSNDSVNAAEFVGACVQNKEHFPLFAHTYPRFLETLNRLTLLQLSQDFYLVIPILFQKHASNLRTFEILFLLQKHPERRDDIIASYKQTASEEQIRMLDLGILLTEREDLSGHMPEIVSLLGMDAVHIYVDAHADKENSPATRSFLVDFLTLFVPDKPADFFKALEIEDKRHLINMMIAFTGEEFSGYKEARSFFEAVDSIKDFGNCLSYREFTKFTWLFPCLVSVPISPSSKKSYFQYVLEHSFESPDQPEQRSLFITSYLQDSLSQATQVLANTPPLLLALLQQPSFANQLATNPLLLNRMAMAAGYARFSDDDAASLAGLPDPFLATYRAFHLFYKNYLIHCDAQSDENPKMPLAVFSEAVEVTGFFPDLFFIQTEDFSVPYRVLQQAVSMSYSDQLLNDAQRKQWRALFAEVLLSKLHEPIDSLLQLYQINHSDLILELLSENTTSPKKIKFLARLSTHDWAKRHLSGEYLRSDFPQDYCVNNLLPFFYENEKNWTEWQNSELNQLVAHFNDPDQLASQEQTFTLIVAKWKETFQKRYPLSYFSCYITIKESPLYRSKIDAFEALEHHTTSQQPLNTNQSLEHMLSLLEVSGINHETLNGLATSLDQDTYAALCTLITLEKEKYAYHDQNLYNKILAHAAQDEPSVTRLAINFYKLAVYAVQKHHKTMSGDALNAIVLAHGDTILPIIQDLQLGVEFYSGKELQRTVEQIASKPSMTIESCRLTKEEMIHSLLIELNQLANAIFTRVNDTDPVEAIRELHAKLLGAVRINDLSDAVLSNLLNTYIEPNDVLEAKRVMISWLLKLTLANNQTSKDKLLALMASPETAPLTLSCLTDYLIHPQSTCPNETMRSFLGDNIADKIVSTHLQRISPEHAPSLLPEINALLLSHKLNLSILSQLTTEHLITIHQVAGYLNSAFFNKVLDLQQLPFTLSAEQLPWFILFDQGMLTPTELQALDKTSISYLSYVALHQTALPLDEALQRMQDTKTILAHPKMIFLEEKMVQSIRNEITRLLLDKGNTKADVLKSGQKEITMLIVNAVLTQGRPLLHDGFAALIQSIRQKLNTLIKHPTLNVHRSTFNWIPLMGLEYTLRAITLPIPKVKSSEVGFFCRPDVVRALGRLNDSLTNPIP